MSALYFCRVTNMSVTLFLMFLKVFLNIKMPNDYISFAASFIWRGVFDEFMIPWNKMKVQWFKVHSKAKSRLSLTHLYQYNRWA